MSTTTDERRIADLEASASVAPPRPTQGDTAARSARKRALHFAGLVRDESADGLGAYLDDLTLDQLYGLTVALAAMVPVDVPVSELTAWLTDLEGAA